MYDQRFDQVTNVLVHHSTKIQPGEVVLVEAIDIPEYAVISVVNAVYEAGGTPLVELKNSRIQRELILRGDAAGMKLIGDYEIYRMKKVDAFIGIRGSHNISEMSDVPEKATQRFKKNWLQPLNAIRVPQTKWVVLRYPHPAMAQQAQMSTQAFEDYFFKVCTLDYGKMEQAMTPLTSLMEATDEVHIADDNGTDLRFSIKDIGAVGCAGEYNVPDGEVFSAPVRDSVNGTIQFNTPTIHQGKIFTDIRLRFKNGEIVEATANDTKTLNEILDTDEGARYLGEFAIAFNPHIEKPILDILFDEKITGSLHITPGQAYEEADNGNRSAVHWDMVMIQTPKHGGGDIYFDGNHIRRDGRFIHPELVKLNPEHLK